jgi:hypothetical protein
MLKRIYRFDAPENSPRGCWHLWRRSPGELGGALLEASLPDFKARDLKPLIAYQVTQVRKLGIPVLKEAATAETLKAAGYEAVIVATGATPCV